ncbi:HAMP domain-containing sensor histidine kinase [Microvirga sp. CF3062]|uniref:sensor histidine kinase n=1 Tax=Microvirga sp. CF3062 TaxID=3110182 RepID=UPI002E79C0F4|nr:HAMP domain-containing sensor histidine kinase [Microvirga sp. CF3062]MEE1655680.1 HAMP domain-containing sensor histidine kinase [Microvirga sp. CF3062]
MRPEQTSLGGRILSQFGLSARLLLLTVLFVMIAEVLIYVPSVANFRLTWLNDRLAAAQIAAMVLDAAPEESLPEDLEIRLLQGVGARAIALRGGGRRSLLAAGDVPPEVGKTVDLRDVRWVTLVQDAFDVLLTPTDKPIRVIGSGMGVDFVEMILDQRPLRHAMIEFSRNILFLSLFISIITAGLVYLTLQWVIVRPVRRLTGNIAEFSSNPEDASRVIRPTDRVDEIGLAEQALARMETTLADELRQKRRLAQLGLAVSKINHELRNMLTTAQLLTDRLDNVSDDSVQRIAPRLVSTLDRAIAFCETTLAYGRATEPLPQRRLIPLAPLIDELSNLTDLAPEVGIAFQADVPDGLMIDADPDQLSRVLVNVVRNAVQALSQTGSPNGHPCIDISAHREGSNVVILIKDNGPGIPERAKANLFTPFQGSAQKGGTGLGLPIAAELVQLHGGTIILDEGQGKTCFKITVPDRLSPVEAG